MDKEIQQPTNRELIDYALTAGQSWTIDWDTLPEATRSYYEARRELLTADNTEGKRLRNDLFNDVLNKVGLYRMKDANMSNQFASWREENMSFGNFIEEMIIAPAKAEAYDPISNKIAPWFGNNPTIKAVYTEVNFTNRYPVQSKQIEMSKMFSYDNGEALTIALNKIVDSISQGYTRDSFIAAKELVNTAVFHEPNGCLPNEEQIVELPYDLRDATLGTQEAATCAALIQGRLAEFTFNSTKFNAAEVERSITPARCTLALHYQAAINKGVKGLGYMYNPEYAEAGVPILTFDKLSEELKDVIGFAYEDGTFSIHQKEFELDPDYNAATGFNVYHLRVQEVYRYSPFGAFTLFVAPGTKAALVKKINKQKKALTDARKVS